MTNISIKHLIENVYNNDTYFYNLNKLQEEIEHTLSLDLTEGFIQDKLSKQVQKFKEEVKKIIKIIKTKDTKAGIEMIFKLITFGSKIMQFIMTSSIMVMVLPVSLLISSLSYLAKVLTDIFSGWLHKDRKKHVKKAVKSFEDIYKKIQKMDDSPAKTKALEEVRKMIDNLSFGYTNLESRIMITFAYYYDNYTPEDPDSYVGDVLDYAEVIKPLSIRWKDLIRVGEGHAESDFLPFETEIDIVSHTIGKRFDNYVEFEQAFMKEIEKINPNMRSYELVVDYTDPDIRQL